MTTCTSCGKANPPEHKFCGECGVPLPLRITAAPEVEAPNEVRTERRLHDSRLPLEGERKQVTVLFADIKGSLELLADRDPEDANRLLDTVLHIMMDAVHHYEGTVSQARGDGVMALFGAPVAHEDHALRACYAALRIQAAITDLSEKLWRDDSMAVQVRIGMHSGEVVLRAMRNDRYVEYTAVGQTVHLAGRMEQLAAPGKIFTTAHTVELAQGRVETRALGPVEIRGLNAPVEVHELTGADSTGSRLAFVRGRGLTPFVGREAEIELLRAALLDAESGLGQMICVVGDAGVGKSRLVHEFMQMEENAEWTVIESSASGASHGRPYAPFIELLRTNFRLDETDTAASTHDKIMDRLGDPSFDQENIPPLLDLLDALPQGHPYLLLEVEQRCRAIFLAMTRLFQFESRARPVFLMLENLDQNDSMSMQLLLALLPCVQQARILLLSTQRPLLQDAPELAGAIQVLRLEPLPCESFSALLEGLLGEHPSTRAIKPFLRQHAAGNPLFAEEIVHSLAETGVLAGSRGAYRLTRALPEFKIPETVQAVIAARIDRVPGEVKRVLQCAAVIGAQVPLALLGTITGQSATQLRGALAHLVSAELLMESRLLPEPEYAFRHGLIQEVAYAELLRSERSAIHARIAEAIEHLYGSLLAEWLEPLAHHAFLGQLWEKALAYLRQAGARAVDRMAHAEAVALYERALEVVDHLPPEPEAVALAIDIRFDIRNALQPLGDHERIARYLREAEVLATTLGDHARLGWVQAYLSDQYWNLGRTEEALAAGARAQVIALELQDLPLQVVTNLSLGLIHHTCGDYPRAMEYFEWNATRLGGNLRKQSFGHFVLPSTFSHSFMACCLADTGDFAQARTAAEAAEHISLEAKHPFSHGYALMGTGVVHLRQGETVLAILALQRALATSGFADSPLGRAYVAGHLGYALVLADRLDEGLEMLQRNVALAEGKGFVARHALRLGYLAESYLRAGQTPQATAVAERALYLAREHGERANEAFALRVLAECAVWRHSSEEAEERFQTCLKLATALQMKPLQAHCHDGLARVFDGNGDFANARKHRQIAEGMLDAMDMRMCAPPSREAPPPALFMRRAVAG